MDYGRGISEAQKRRIAKSNSNCSLFMPKLEMQSQAIYYQKYTDDYGYKSERRIKIKILDEKPQGQNYQEKLKVLILSGNEESKTRWVSRASVSPTK